MARGLNEDQRIRSAESDDRLRLHGLLFKGETGARAAVAPLESAPSLGPLLVAFTADVEWLTAQGDA